jgi:outer membrane lipoprotein-sorting protein
MKKAIRPFLLGRILATQTGSHFAGKCSSLPIAALALAVLSAPYALAQSNSGTSVHSKTVPSNPPAAAPQPAEPQPAPQQPAAAPQAAPPQAAAPAPAAPQAAPAAQAAAPAPNAVGAGGGWDAQFGVAPPQTSQFTAAPEQVEIIQKINGYFNDLKNLEGDFLQTDADDKRKKGKFYIERPGKVRFDYSLPSKQKIISNGKYLAIEDHDLNTTDRYPLESTPFRLLLTKEVDLMKDANIIALDVGDNVVVVTVQDKEAGNGGQIRLFFDWPKLQLKEWIISDPQGLNTRIQLAEMHLNKDADPKLFTFSPDVGLPKFRGGSN